MSDRQKEMFGDPYAEFREMDSHAASLKIDVEILNDIKTGNSDFPPWFYDPEGNVIPEMVAKEVAAVERRMENTAAEILAGRNHPVDTLAYKLDLMNTRDWAGSFKVNA
jgi:hypothetical protein